MIFRTIGKCRKQCDFTKLLQYPLFQWVWIKSLEFRGEIFLHISMYLLGYEKPLCILSMRKLPKQHIGFHFCWSSEAQERLQSSPMRLIHDAKQEYTDQTINVNFAKLDCTCTRHQAFGVTAIGFSLGIVASQLIYLNILSRRNQLLFSFFIRTSNTGLHLLADIPPSSRPIVSLRYEFPCFISATHILVNSFINQNYRCWW